MQRVKLVDVAQDYIKELITENKCDANGFLPSEGELATSLQMSRATIREAVRSMEVRGFVKRIHGKGVKVADNSMDVLSQSIEDLIAKNDDALDDLLEMRVLLEPYGASRAAEYRTDEDLQELEKYVLIMEKSKYMDEKYYEADLAFHRKLANISRNKIFSTFIEAYTQVLKELIKETSKADIPLEQRFHYHRNILNAVSSQDEKLAAEAMEEHLVATDKNRHIKFGIN